MWRKAGRSRVRTEMFQAYRLGLRDDRTEQTMTAREMPDLRGELRGNTDMYELVETMPVARDDAERTVLGPHKLNGGFDDPPKNSDQLYLTDNGRDRTQKRPRSTPLPRRLGLTRSRVRRRHEPTGSCPSRILDTSPPPERYCEYWLSATLRCGGTLDPHSPQPSGEASRKVH